MHLFANKSIFTVYVLPSHYITHAMLFISACIITIFIVHLLEPIMACIHQSHLIWF